MSPKLRIPRPRICARCGPLAPRRKLDRHHPELYSTFFPHVPGWRARHRAFHESDVVEVCAWCHLAFHEQLATPLLWSEWYYIPHRYRTESSARAAASAVSAVFWQWLEDDSWAARNSLLRWAPSSSAFSSQ